MTKRIILGFVASILFLIAFAYYVSAESLFNSGVYSETSLKIADESYYVLGAKPVGDELPNNYSEMFLRRSGNDPFNMVIEYQHCNVRGYFKYCFDGNNYDFEDPGITGPYGMWPKMLLRIEHFDSGITMERPTSIVVNYNEEALIGVSFRNDGVQPIDISYDEIIPSNIRVVNTDNCTVINNLLSKKFTLLRNATLSFGYYVKVKDYDSRSWGSIYSYNLENTPVDGSLAPLVLTVNTPFGITDFLSATESNIPDQTIDYYLLLNNSDPKERLKATVIIEPSYNFNILSTDRMTKNGSKYTNYLEILPGHEEKLSFFARTPLVGDYYVNSNVYLVINGYPFSKYLNKTYRVFVNGLVPEISFDKQALHPGDNITMVASLRNPDASNDFFVIYSTMKGFSEEYVPYPGLSVGQNISFRRSFIVPEFNATANAFNFSFFGSYKTKTNQELKFFVEASLPIVRDASQTGQITEPNPSSNGSNNQSTANTVNQNTNPTANPHTNPQLTNQSTTTPEKPKKDLLTAIFDAINSLIKSIFG